MEEADNGGARRRRGHQVELGGGAERRLGFWVLEFFFGRYCVYTLPEIANCNSTLVFHDLVFLPSLCYIKASVYPCFPFR